MRLAFFLDNRGIAARGSLSDPRWGNPGIGGTEYAFLAVVVLLQSTALEPLLLITAPQELSGLDPTLVAVVADLPEALQRAQQAGAIAVVFRPGAMAPEQWRALENCPLPLVAWLHNLGLEQQARSEGLLHLSHWVLVSGAQLDHFRHSRLARRALVIPNPVAVPPGASRPRSLADAAAAKDLAYVGALTPFKGFDRLAACWGRIAAACPTVRLRVFGAADLYSQPEAADALTPYERHCRRVLQASGHAERVLFEGSCGLERYDTYRTVAVGVVNPTGCDETFCISAAEFSACGIPVVSARRHALVQTVQDGRTGLLARSDRELADHCITLLRDPERAWQLGQAGRTHVAVAYSNEAVVQGWLQLAEEIQAGHASVPPLPSTPWHHEQRWLRQLWGSMLICPAWPSWPSLKSSLKRVLQGGEQVVGPRVAGLLAGSLALLFWAGLVFGKYGGNPTGLARIGDQLPLSPLLQGQPVLILEGKRGNDGQQFLTLALDPLQLEPGSSAALDNPIYRGKRLLYPLLAWLFGFGQPRLIPWTLGLLNVGAIALAAGLVAQWAQLEQRSALWGLAILALPGAWISLSLDTADLLATMLLLATALAWRQRRPGLLWASLSAALLSRETALLGWAASGFTALWERRWRWLLPLALVPMPLLGWIAALRGRFASTADGLLAALHFGWPGVGLLRKASQLLGLAPLPATSMAPVELVFDGLCFALWMATLLVLAATVCRAGSHRWLRVSAALYLLPALCTSTQILARFPDYTRVWLDLAALALLALLSARGPVLGYWLGLSALTAAGYGLGYVLAP
jgi:glycosyltransferase involved in cell wall biosynthesis